MPSAHKTQSVHHEARVTKWIERGQEGISLLQDVVLLVDGEGVRDGDGGGEFGGGGEGLELMEHGLEVDPLGLVQWEVEVSHGLTVIRRERRGRRRPAGSALALVDGEDKQNPSETCPIGNRPSAPKSRQVRLNPRSMEPRQASPVVELGFEPDFLCVPAKCLVFLFRNVSSMTSAASFPTVTETKRLRLVTRIDDHSSGPLLEGREAWMILLL